MYVFVGDNLMGKEGEILYIMIFVFMNSEGLEYFHK